MAKSSRKCDWLLNNSPLSPQSPNIQQSLCLNIVIYA
ncbi:predicted protein [Sclerotinia sclerotiorum 1980 UF-70]|uniref:Uncharacterized protein n=1 Tax=Sclerotinia sclerotiorum (strain ATCC 18683 / 1980 / Ss-1) TaxID=665079 RepID=A7EVR2_SCLS1|nr:predicted protein [Sclerotinia sclerotiorum 1980 UF-70]EDN93554.1 predicted protein [Sclerotinia sclerotiorum 1980 UF-70]